MRHENPEICYACRHSPCRCEMTELEQLKQDHATVKAAFDIYMRDYKGCDWIAMTGIMEKKIAKLEAEADPWLEAKECVDAIEKGRDVTVQWQLRIARYVRHLESENAAKDARIAELEAELAAIAAVVDVESLKYDAKADFAKVPPNDLDGMSRVHSAAKMVSSLQAIARAHVRENAELKARIASLEAREVPPLDPDRVYSTAAKMCSDFCLASPFCIGDAGDAEPYPLQEPK